MIITAGRLAGQLCWSEPWTGYWAAHNPNPARGTAAAHRVGFAKMRVPRQKRRTSQAPCVSYRAPASSWRGHCRSQATSKSRPGYARRPTGTRHMTRCVPPKPTLTVIFHRFTQAPVGRMARTGRCRSPGSAGITPLLKLRWSSHVAAISPAQLKRGSASCLSRGKMALPASRLARRLPSRCTRSALGNPLDHPARPLVVGSLEDLTVRQPPLRTAAALRRLA